MPICSKCNKNKIQTDFCKNEQYKSGYTYICKICYNFYLDKNRCKYLIKLLQESNYQCHNCKCQLDLDNTNFFGYKSEFFIIQCIDCYNETTSIPRHPNSKLKFIQLISDKKGKFGLYECQCGKQIETKINRAVTGHIKSCGCITKNHKPTGESAFNALYRRYEYNAKEDGKEFVLSKDDVRLLTQNKCFYCNKDPSQRLFKSGNSICNGEYVYNGIDRVNNNIGYVLNNCVPCCKICNIMKQRLSLNDFYDHIEIIYNNMKDKEIL